MKKCSPLLVISLVLLVLAFSAGCSSKETPNQRDSFEHPTVTIIPPTMNTERMIPQVERSGPSLTRPQVSPGSTLPVPTGTIGTMLYENLTGIMVTAQAVSATWDPDGLSCNAKSCTAGFVNANGDTVKVQTTLYDTIDLAKAAYNSEKQKDEAYRTVPLEIPDESYGWMQKSQSGVVFRKSNVVVVVDYTTSSGPASITMAKEFATMYSQKL